MRDIPILSLDCFSVSNCWIVLFVSSDDCRDECKSTLSIIYYLFVSISFKYENTKWGFSFRKRCCHQWWMFQTWWICLWRKCFWLKWYNVFQRGFFILINILKRNYLLLRSSKLILLMSDDLCSSSEFCNIWCSGKVDFSLHERETFVSREIDEYFGIVVVESNGSKLWLLVVSKESYRWTHVGIVIFGSSKVCCFSFRLKEKCEIRHLIAEKILT